MSESRATTTTAKADAGKQILNPEPVLWDLRSQDPGRTLEDGSCSGVAGKGCDQFVDGTVDDLGPTSEPSQNSRGCRIGYGLTISASEFAREDLDRAVYDCAPKSSNLDSRRIPVTWPQFGVVGCA